MRSWRTGPQFICSTLPGSGVKGGVEEMSPQGDPELGTHIRCKLKCAEGAWGLSGEGDPEHGPYHTCHLCHRSVVTCFRMAMSPQSRASYPCSLEGTKAPRLVLKLATGGGGGSGLEPGHSAPSQPGGWLLRHQRWPGAPSVGPEQGGLVLPWMHPSRDLCLQQGYWSIVRSEGC